MTPIQQACERLAAELAIAEDMKASAIVRTDDLRRLLDGPTEEEVARAIEEADAELSYEITLTKLVRGVSTYALKMGGETSEHANRRTALDATRARLGKLRARAVLALFGRKS